MYAVILAGGEGTRLWPLSRPDRPKPFLPLLGPTTLLQRTVARIEPLVPIRDVYVVTDRRFVALVREQVPGMPAENIIGEPMGRNTAAAIALAGRAIDRGDDEAMLVLPADHQVLDEDGFREALSAAAAVCADGTLVTLGITPSGPETGYGYVMARLDGEAESEAGEGDARRARAVERFVEKPDAARAAALLATGAASWNSGIFIWTRRAICEELTRYAPDVIGPIDEALAAALASAAAPAGSDTRATAVAAALDRAYPALRARSIDYAVMEPASLEGRVRVVPIDVGWSDLGSWAALRDAWIEEDAGAAQRRRDTESAGTDGAATNARRVTGSGNRRDIDSSDCLVLAGDRLVVTVGLSGVIVVDTPDALLVCAADRAQDVRRIATQLAAEAAAATVATAEQETEGNP